MYRVKIPVAVSPVFKLEQLICLYSNNVWCFSGSSTGIPLRYGERVSFFISVSLLPVIVDHGIS